MKVDPITLAVIVESALDSIVDEMAYAVIRTARSEIPPRVPTFSESAPSAESWSSKIIFDSYGRRPMSVDFPSSTEPQVMKRRQLLV
jgi:hypothetical protein